MALQGGVADSIASRTSKLNQMFQGRKLKADQKSIVGREGLLDALFVLYDECSSEYLMKNEYIAEFVKKYSSTISDLKDLRINPNDFEVKNIIGRGHFGEVQVVREKYTGDVYALKVLRKADTLAQQNVTFYEEERDIMAKAQNAWITQLQYAFQDKQHLYLVMEFHPGGDLLSLLARYDDVFEESMAKFYLAEMVLAVRALHTMGYVHRDVKPENILIDRTGHIKLADFGSACRLSDANSGKIVHVTVSNMPVGTPDYICPEVLQKMNSSDNRGKFGEECDWWSLGICAYEMLFGKTPFTDEKGSMVVTYANIMSFKKCLKFPSETEVTSDAMNLMKCLLTDADRRLKYEGICIHRFFSDIDFDNIRQTTPPFIPTITSKDDTSNFDEFEKAQPPPSLDQYKRKTEFSGKHLPFIGFTFTKSLVNERPSLTSNLTSEVSSPAAKNSLERRLQTKTKELQDTREKCSDLENRNVSLAADKERLKVQVKEKESQFRVVQNERDCLERDVAHYISEIKSLKRLLEVEKEERNNMDSKAMVLLEEITKQNEHAQKLREETTREEVDTCHEIIAQLEEERKSLNKKIDRLEREIKDERQTSNKANSKVTELQGRLSQLQRNIKVSAEECTAEMKSRERDFSVRENELQDKLDKAFRQTQEATEMLKRTREEKMRYEEELMTIKRKSGVQEALRQRLSDSEEKRKSLETQMHRLQIMERREEELKRQVTEKSHHITQLAERIAEIEESLQSTQFDKKKEEKIAKKREQQLKDRIHELTENIEMLSHEKSNLQDQSLMAFEEHEEKLHKIQQQEATIAQLKGNISRLETQIKAMKVDLEKPRSPSPRRKMNRRSGWAQTDFSPEKVSFPRKTSGWAQTNARKSRSPVKNLDWMSLWDKTNNLSTPHEYPYVYKLTGDKVKARRSKSLDKTATWVQAQNEAVTTSSDRRSNQTQTESVSRRSNQMQTEVQTNANIPDEVVVSVKFNGDNRRSSNGTGKFVDSPETGYKSDSPQSSMTENNVSSILAGHGDGPFTSHATVNLAECTFPLSTRAMKGDDSETEVFSSTVDSESEHNVTVLRHVNNCDAEVQTYDSKEKRKKTVRRRESEEISDLKQQKLYLEARVSSLEREIQEIRDGTHQQRIRALDLKHELREKTTMYETQIAELREKLCKTELLLSDAQETANNLKEKDSTMKEKFEKLQRDLDVTKMDSRRNVTSLQLWKRHRLGKVHEETNDDLEAQLKTFKERCAKLENVEQEVRTLRVESKQLAPKNKDLEEQLRMALDDKTRFKMEADRHRDELNEKRRQCDTLEQRVRQLKSLCEELDSQIQDYEEMNRQYEQKESQWKQDRSTYERAVEEREDESNDTRRLLQKERENRQKAEDRAGELNSALSSTQKAYQNEINALKKKTKEQREKIDVLNNQLTMMEKKFSLLELDEKNVNRKLLVRNEENIKLKEETSKLITQTTELKNSNLKLSKQVEEAMDRYDLQANQKSDLENRIETDQANYRHELYKLESQIGQQTKLIMYLQDKVENPPKRKKGLFGGGGGGGGSTSVRRPDGVPGIQYRELQHSLEHERDKNSTLRQEILRLRDELHVSKAEAMRNLSRSASNTPESSLLSSASYNTAHSMSFATAQNVQQEVTLSPATQNQRHHQHRQQRHHDFVAIDSVDGKLHSLGTMKPQRERMHHNIPHRFITGLNSRPTKCAVCLGSVHFVKPAAKCQECHVVCHPKCSASLPATCGLPTEYAKHFANMLKQARKFSTTRLSVADLKLQLEGWMKTPRPGKSVWEKKWVILGNNHVYIYSSDNTEDADPVEEFDLRPSNGFVTIHSAVTAAELTNTASTDLPYILRLEFEPETTCWPGRSLYLMALNFSDKQKWVATLEAIITHSPDTFKRKDAKLLGNTILTTSDEKRLEINCSLSLSDKNLLLGADEGLYLLDLTTASRPPVKVTGIGGVYQMSLLDGSDTVAVITGKERQVSVLDILHLRNANSYSTPSVSPRNVEQAFACTCFALGVIGDGLFMCAALADRILILKWNPNLGNFSSRKELTTSQACSCMYFGRKHIVVGTDRFHKIDVYSYKMSEFLDKHDNTLAFAAFGAAYYDSFPIAVLQLAPPEQHEEYLLCYHEFGVFVDSYGRRSREDDMKWGGLPLGFAYRAPYLYITHFNTLQVVHINSSHKDSVYGNKTFLTLPSPRYLGPAQSDQAVYIGSSHDRTAEILVFKGNMVAADDVDGMKSSVETYRTCTDKENSEPLYAKITKKKSASSLRKATRRSPPKPQNKSTPLKTRNQRVMRHDTSDSDDSDLSLTDEALYSTPIEAKIEVRRYVGKSAYVSTSDQDTSF